MECRIYLDGKDTEGRTKYLSDDMTTHTHQGRGARQLDSPGQARRSLEKKSYFY